MNVTRDVILDLLPLYVAGEASPATCVLVEDYLKGDPELAARARELKAEQGVSSPDLGPRQEIAMQSFRRTRRVLAWQRWLFAMGVAFTAISFSTTISFHGTQVTGVRMLIFDKPLTMGAMLLIGLACFVAYYFLRRRHRTER